MSVIFRKQKEGTKMTTIGRLSIIIFISALSFALIDTIWAIYMDSFLNNIALVGFLSALFTLVSFISYFFFIPFVQKTSKSKIYSYTLLLFAVCFALFAINTKFYFFVVLAFILTILITLKVTSMGIIIKDKSSRKLLSRNEGLVYTFANVSWLIGPLIAGFIAEKYGINLVFVLASIFSFIAFLLFKLSKIKDSNIKKKQDSDLIKNFFEFFKDKNRVFAYLLGGGVNLWWTLIYLFIPLFIIRNGLHEIWIGYFLSAVTFPLILFEYQFGKLAGKVGFRKIFKIGYIIPCILVVMCFFIGNIYFILLLLVLASIGLAMLEPTTESYFLDITKGKNMLRFYGPYNTTIDVSSFIGKVLASALILFFPFKSIFLLFGFLMFIMFLISFRTKNVIEAKR